MKIGAPSVQDAGYNYSIDEDDDGTRVTVRRKGTVVGEVTTGHREGEEDGPARIMIRRFDVKELQEIIEIDEPSN